MPSYVVEESSNFARVFWLKQEELIKDIKRWAISQGTDDENVLKIILFGSLAQRRAVPGSDADILILLREDERSFGERVVSWQKRFALNFPVEIFPYTEKEKDSPIAAEAMKQGMVLFERKGYPKPSASPCKS